MGRAGIVTQKPKALPELELLSRVFRSLGDPTRLQLLETLLACGSATQSDLLDRVEVSQSRVSEHLQCLVWCGFVTAERDGRTVVYRVGDVRAREFIALARGFIAGNDAAVGRCTIQESEGRLARGSAS